MTRFLHIALGLAGLTLAGHASASDPPFNWQAYPEMARERVLPQIITALRGTLKDPESATNLSICLAPVKVKIEDGRPVRWTYFLSLNARNGFGGYTGEQGFAAVIYSDRPAWVFASPIMPPVRDLADCERVADAEVHRLIEGR